MNYAKIYDALIERGRTRTLTGYSERHHIIPRCMGGSNDASNIVRLTPEEHFVVHQLLVRMHPEVPRLIFALLALSMNAGGRMNNKMFGWLRRRLAAELKRSKTGVPRPPWVIEKARLGLLGRVATPEHVANMRASLKGRPHSPEHNAKVGRKGRTSPMKGRTQSPETREKQRQAALARKHTPETIEKLTAVAAAQTQEQRSARAHKAWQTKRAKAAREG